MAKHYVTFGQQHTHRINGHTLDCDTVAVFEASDHNEGRGIAVSYFGDNFFTDYHGDQWNESEQLKFFPKGYAYIDKPAEKIQNSTLYGEIDSTKFAVAETVKIAVRYKGELVGFKHKDSEHLEIVDHALYASIIEQSNQPVMISSRYVGEIDRTGKIISEKEIDCEIVHTKQGSNS